MKSGLTEFLANAYARGHVLDEAGPSVRLAVAYVERNLGAALHRRGPGRVPLTSPPPLERGVPRERPGARLGRFVRPF